MARVTLQNIGHSYTAGAPIETWALKPFDMTWENGKTYSLVGPSGCGKTTLLNIVSGIVRPSQGRVLFDDKDVTDLPTSRRNIAQVFQFPVIYQSMTVYDNLVFPLVCRNWSKERIAAKVKDVAEVLGLGDQLKKTARSLNADDKQLISLGRGLVRDDVAALLMDEPLTVIDPQMKFHLRRKIKEINQQFGQTVVYVTHDQYEAMTFADDVLVMSNGRVVQSGTPEELFESPQTAYVGYFIGSPAMNFIDVKVSNFEITLGGKVLKTRNTLAGEAGGKIQIGIRPEYLSIARDDGENSIPATIVDISDFGSLRVLKVTIGGQIARLKVSREDGIPSSREILLNFPAKKTMIYRDSQLLA
ncbi:MAG: ABC transporter ATP-binding protein [Candidatus Nanopelagicaceae bacterium]|nr:ABC transporter ATP-binding protein [Candidatus Nanopelagicaceae bacterium]